MAVVATSGSGLLGSSQGPVGGHAGNLDAWAAKPGAYEVKVGYFPCDQTCAVAEIPAHVGAAQASCVAHVKVTRGKTTRVTAAYDSGKATCLPFPPR